MSVPLFDPYELGGVHPLRNRIVMAPMTRTRADEGGIPNRLMAKYYGQRTGAGLIVTEATDVSPRSKGYAWTPGLHTDAQVEGWRLVANEVHRRGGTIFLQIWHVGRMAHTSLMPNGQAPLGVTDERADHSDVFAYSADGQFDFVRASQPRQIRTDEIPGLVKEFALAFKHAKLAGFDGVEIHAANGYLFDQFMNSTLNKRADIYGAQTPENRIRLLLEVVDVATREFGAGSVGIRVSPFGKYNSMPFDPHAAETLFSLCAALNLRQVAYLHLVYQLMPSGNMDSSKFQETHLSDDLVSKIRETFRHALVWCGGFTKQTAEAALRTGWVDLIAFGRPFVSNPDLVARLKNNWPLVDAPPSVFYVRDGERGYTDFPEYHSSPIPAGHS